MAWTHRIGNRLLAAFLGFAGLSLAVLALAFYWQSQTRRLLEIRQTSEAMRLAVQEARLGIQNTLLQDAFSENFMKSGQSASTRQVDSALVKVSRQSAHLGDMNELAAWDLAGYPSQIREQAQAAGEQYKNLRQQLRVRGFKNQGLEGRMREQVHRLEEEIEARYTAEVLMLRRYEKDFLLRKDLKYVGKLREAALQLQNHLPAARQKQEVAAYVSLFEQVVQSEQALGLSAQEGLKGALEARLSVLDQSLSQFETNLAQALTSSVSAMQRLFWGLGGLSLLLGFLAAPALARGIARPIVGLQTAVHESGGNYFSFRNQVQKLKLKGELADLAQVFADNLKTMGETLHQAQEQSQKLSTLLEENDRRNWRNQGLSQLGSLLGRLQDQPDELFPQFVNALSRYVSAVQGVLYTLEELDPEFPVLRPVATFAGTGSRASGLPVVPGEGLVGQAWKNAQPLVVNDLPANYLRIRSGLGETSARSVILQPVLFNGTCLGVLEVAFLEPAEAIKQDFLHRIAEQLGVSLSVIRSRALAEARSASGSSFRERDEVKNWPAFTT